MSDAPGTEHRPASESLAQQAQNARARGLAYVLRLFLDRKAAGRLSSLDGPDAKERSLDDSRADKASIPKQL
jgi:hypothetical protein